MIRLTPPLGTLPVAVAVDALAARLCVRSDTLRRASMRAVTAALLDLYIEERTKDEAAIVADYKECG